MSANNSPAGPVKGETTIELHQRKLMILACVVKIYIETGEPVGSKSIASILNLSSATIRNEMSALEEMGYLTQPHTSAGRIPTRSGFRLYVDRLMHRYHLTDEDKKQIKSMLPKSFSDPYAACAQVSSALAELTRCAAISTASADEKDKIRRIEIIPIDSRSALIILLTEYGIVKSRICKCSYDLTPEIIEQFLSLCNTGFAGRPLHSLYPGALQTLSASLDSRFLEIMPLFSALAYLVEDLKAADVRLGGGVNLLDHRDFTPGRTKELLEFLARSDAMLTLFSSLRDSLNVVLGDEIKIRELDDSGMIVAKYNAAGHLSGSIGVVGPLRMDYEHIIPSIRYMAELLGRMFEEEAGGL